MPFCLLCPRVLGALDPRSWIAPPKDDDADEVYILRDDYYVRVDIRISRRPSCDEGGSLTPESAESPATDSPFRDALDESPATDCPIRDGLAHDPSD